MIAAPGRRLAAALVLALALLPATGAAAAAAAAAAAEAAPPPVALRPASVVPGPALTLGDLFANAGAKAGIRIGDAPAAGATLVLDAGRLAAIARGHGLAWKPASPAEKAVIERDSLPLTADDIAQPVLLELTRKGFDTEALSVEPALASRQLYRARNARVMVDAVTTDPAGRRFSAIIAIVGEGEARQTLPVSGRLARAVLVPVLKRALRPGEAIGPADLAWSEVADRRIPANALREPERLIGHAARRALPPGSVILASDLRPAKLVAKGQAVTLVLAAPGMQLTAGGIAQEDGGAGDVIRVANDRSRSIVAGTVTGPGTIAVGPAAALPPAPRR